MDNSKALPIMRHTTAGIIQRAAFAALDCGEGSLEAHVRCAFDLWINDQLRRPEGQGATCREHAAVVANLAALGFTL